MSRDESTARLGFLLVASFFLFLLHLLLLFLPPSLFSQSPLIRLPPSLPHQTSLILYLCLGHRQSWDDVIRDSEILEERWRRWNKSWKWWAASASSTLVDDRRSGGSRAR